MLYLSQKAGKAKE